MQTSKNLVAVLVQSITLQVQVQMDSFSTVIFTTTARGARMILYSGYKFLRHLDLGLKTRWRCGTHHRSGCRAVIFTFKNDILKCSNEHNHSPMSAPIMQFLEMLLSSSYVSFLTDYLKGKKRRRFSICMYFFIFVPSVLRYFLTDFQN